MRFKVVGPRSVAKVKPGGIVEIDDPKQARVLQIAGHIGPAIVPAKKAKPKVKVEDGDVRTD